VKSLIKYIEAISLRQFIAILVMAAFPLFLILSLNVLFGSGIPYNPLTYLCALFLYYATKPKVVMPAPMIMTLGLEGMPSMGMSAPLRPRPNLHIVKPDDNETPPTAS
jgi:hypothetical protein